MELYYYIVAQSIILCTITPHLNSSKIPRSFLNVIYSENAPSRLPAIQYTKSSLYDIIVLYTYGTVIAICVHCLYIYTISYYYIVGVYGMSSTETRIIPRQNNLNSQKSNFILLKKTIILLKPIWPVPLIKCPSILTR